MDAGPDVRFDFANSLVLARRLWALAAQIDTMMGARRTLAADALTSWLGTYGTQFANRVNTEGTDIARISADLRASANGWATCWQQAMDQQNRVLYAREVNRVESERSAWDSFAGFFVGHDDLPDMPASVGTPVAPGFAPTATLVRY